MYLQETHPRCLPAGRAGDYLYWLLASYVASSSSIAWTGHLAGRLVNGWRVETSPSLWSEPYDRESPNAEKWPKKWPSKGADLQRALPRDILEYLWRRRCFIGLYLNCTQMPIKSIRSLRTTCNLQLIDSGFAIIHQLGAELTVHNLFICFAGSLLKAL